MNAPLEALREILALHPVVLTGAGCSTESGIPDYRGEGTARRARAGMQHRDFVDDPRTRAKYWARSIVGWPRLDAAQPNAAHHALAQLERTGRIMGVITQNVDRLHHKAGSERIVELHGSVADVRCLACDSVIPRAELQPRLLGDNALPDDVAAIPQAPDGDAEREVDLDAFVVPPCLRCGGVLKPDVVFFGGSVPKRVLDDAWSVFDEAGALLVVGSSLTVFSGFRFVREADKRGLPIGILNIGATRGDPLATCRVDGAAGELLPRLV